jgi:hypothetical protein
LQLLAESRDVLRSNDGRIVLLEHPVTALSLALQLHVTQTNTLCHSLQEDKQRIININRFTSNQVMLSDGCDVLHVVAVVAVMMGCEEHVEGADGTMPLIHNSS